MTGAAPVLPCSSISGVACIYDERRLRPRNPVNRTTAMRQAVWPRVRPVGAGHRPAAQLRRSRRRAGTGRSSGRTLRYPHRPVM